MAPPRYAYTPGMVAPENRGFWRNLMSAVVPVYTGLGTEGGKTGRELVHGLQATASSCGRVGEANGPAMRRIDTFGIRFAIAGADIARFLPTATPLSVFSFLVRRGSDNSIASLVSNASSVGWTFQLSYGSGQIGLTRWGVADNPTTTLGAVPSGGAASCVGMSHNGTTARFFMNGRFENVASGAVLAPGGDGSGQYQFMCHAGSGAGVPNVGAHVIYVWGRTLADGEFLRLMQDPFAPIRPRHTVFDAASLTGTARATQLVGEVLASPSPGLRATQIVAEVLLPQMGRVRATQLLAEVITKAAAGTGRARITQALGEVLWTPTPSLRATQLVAEVLAQADVTLRVTQLLAEVVSSPSPAIRATQSVGEVLVQVAALTPTYTGQLFPRGSPPPF